MANAIIRLLGKLPIFGDAIFPYKVMIYKPNKTFPIRDKAKKMKIFTDEKGHKVLAVHLLKENKDMQLLSNDYLRDNKFSVFNPSDGIYLGIKPDFEFKTDKFGGKQLVIKAERLSNAKSFSILQGEIDKKTIFSSTFWDKYGSYILFTLNIVMVLAMLIIFTNKTNALAKMMNNIVKNLKDGLGPIVNMIGGAASNVINGTAPAG
jgi:hypothetical protein